METKNIQTVKLNIINRITAIDDKSMLQKVWNIISSDESSQETKKVYSKEEKEILNGIKKGLKEVQLIEKGKLKATPIKEFLDEL